MKYSIEREKKKYSNAGSKAVRDTSAILHQLGYKPYVYDPISANFVSHNLKRIWRIVKLYFALNREDICFLQWPAYSTIGVDKLLYYTLKKKCNHLTLLIHDLTSIRINKNAKVECSFLRLAETLIVHTEEMSKWAVSKGVDKNRIKVLSSFDYLLSNNNIPQRKKSNEIVFAGNLEKSDFLYKINESLNDISLNCYGKETKRLIAKPLIYKGSFDADDVSRIEGSWGLVWDGNSTETCSGLIGEYLRINSPHKVSLYIVAKLPIIIWREAALAGYVQEKCLGILIDSIEEIPNAISKISDKEYQIFLHNINKERDLLTNGMHLINCIKQ